jgi:MinD superfamily P-loop ATPase
MMELVVVSGKGGTGKTSLVGSLAALSRNKVLVDCDVDAADLHLILRNNVKKTTKFIAGKRAYIIDEKCTNCGICIDYCRFDAIKNELDSGNTGEERCWIDEYACDGCGVCVRHCAEQAIDFREVVSGEWYLSDTPYGPLVHARLGIAQANSGKLVSVLRQEARLLADVRGLDLIIVDGPPGIGCPVIASITGTGYVLVVTEPSMSALHDMERLLQLTAHFGIKTGICINKADINPEISDRIEEKARKSNLPVLGRIPHDEAVIKAQVNRKSVVENGDCPAARDIRILWERIKDAIS